VDNRRLILGYYFSLGNSLLSWLAKKRNTSAQSSSEVEYRALGSATCGLQWLTYLLKDSQVTCESLTVLYCDTQSALHIAANLVFP